MIFQTIFLITYGVIAILLWRPLFRYAAATADITVSTVSWSDICVGAMCNTVIAGCWGLWIIPCLCHTYGNPGKVFGVLVGTPRSEKEAHKANRKVNRIKELEDRNRELEKELGIND
jgi:hypothetical protein